SLPNTCPEGTICWPMAQSSPRRFAILAGGVVVLLLLLTLFLSRRTTHVPSASVVLNDAHSRPTLPSPVVATTSRRDGGTIEGVVQTPDGTAVSGAVVILVPRERQQEGIP